MKKTGIFALAVVLIMLMTLAGCTNTLPQDYIPSPAPSEEPSPQAESNPPAETAMPMRAKVTIEPYEDLRPIYMNPKTQRIIDESEYIYNPDDLITFTFNERTVFNGNEELQKQTMENGKNPGLGVRSLHEKGITGKGVNVAIIDQNLLLNHPEFDGKIAAYYDAGCGTSDDKGSMHAPAVASILVGDTIGTAPDAKVYFAAAPSWKADSHYEADALYWIIEENKKLSDGEKIRVVSVSAAPSGEGTQFTKNTHEWDEAVLAAQNEGILILDCRLDSKTGIIGSAYYDPANPEDVSRCTGGWPTWAYKIPSSMIGVPTSYRTVAEEYVKGYPSYQYTGQGGLSWGIPYAAGVLALGWQVNPNLDNDEIVQILFDTCATAKDGSNIINPVAFIDAVKETKE